MNKLNKNKNVNLEICLVYYSLCRNPKHSFKLSPGSHTAIRMVRFLSANVLPLFEDSLIGVYDSRLDISTNIERKRNIYISEPMFECSLLKTNQISKLKISLLFNDSSNTLRLIYSPGIW